MVWIQRKIDNLNGARIMLALPGKVPYAPCIKNENEVTVALIKNPTDSQDFDLQIMELDFAAVGSDVDPAHDARLVEPAQTYRLPMTE
jgi:hypothetical protein